jgi:hypothetical protein
MFLVSDISTEAKAWVNPGSLVFPYFSSLKSEDSMARINVDDSWFVDTLKRRAALIKAVQTVPVDHEWVADGMALAAWKLAQEFWKKDRQLIPEDVWARAGFEPLIQCGLAERHTAGIYVLGTESRNDWLLKRTKSSAAGGLKSAEVRRQKYGSAIPQNATNQNAEIRSAAEVLPKQNDQNSEVPSEVPPNPLALTLALTPSLTHLRDSDESREPDEFNPRILFELWNTHSGRLPKVLKLTESMKRKINARWTEEPNLAYWEAAIKNMATSSFCLEGGWADFHWLIKNDTNHMKAASGKYKNRGAPKKPSLFDTYGITTEGQQ